MSGSEEAGAAGRAVDDSAAPPAQQALVLSEHQCQCVEEIRRRFLQEPAILQMVRECPTSIATECYNRVSKTSKKGKMYLLMNMLCVYNTARFGEHFRLSAHKVQNILEELQGKSVTRFPELSDDDVYTNNDAISVQEVFIRMPDDIATWIASKHVNAEKAITHVAEMIDLDDKMKEVIEELLEASTKTGKAEDSRLDDNVVAFVMMYKNFHTKNAVKYINRLMNPEVPIEFANLSKGAQGTRKSKWVEVRVQDRVPDQAQDPSRKDKKRHLQDPSREDEQRRKAMQLLHEEDMENIVLPDVSMHEVEQFLVPFMEKVRQNVQHLDPNMDEQATTIRAVVIDLALGIMNEKDAPMDLLKVKAYTDIACDNKCCVAIALVSTAQKVRPQTALERLYAVDFDVKRLLMPAPDDRRSGKEAQ